jgi:hypothetical protein
MSANRITCPHCSSEILLSDVAKHAYEQEFASMQEKLTLEFQKKEEVIKEDLRRKAVEWAEKKSKEDGQKLQQELVSLQERNQVLQKEKQQAFENELILRKKQQELEDRAKAMDLEIARKIQEEKLLLEKKAQWQFDAQLLQERELFKQQLQEQEKKLENVTRSLEEAQWKARRWSQQIQWEVQENELKQELLQLFPWDIISDVPPWIRWADLIQQVCGITGRVEGVIVWESKNTKIFSHDWIKKLKDDAVSIKWDLAILVTQALPEGIDKFWIIDGVWVTDIFSYKPLITLARERILLLAQERRSQYGKEEKMHILYGYLASQEFRWKIEWVIDAFSSLKEDLESEKAWSRYEPHCFTLWRYWGNYGKITSPYRATPTYFLRWLTWIKPTTFLRLSTIQMEGLISDMPIHHSLQISFLVMRFCSEKR